MSTDGPRLREVRGPSALGGGWRRTRELLYLMAATEFKRTYLGTVLGPLWTVARPLMLFAVLLVVFTKAFHINANVPHYPELLLLNIVLFTFFQEATTTSVSSIVSREAVVRKTQFPRLVIPLSVVLTSVFNLGPNLIVVFAFMLGAGVTPMWSWLGLIPIIGLLAVITTAVSMLVASLYPRFRDVGIIWTVLVTALFYATPVLYPISKVSGTVRDLIALNPLTPLFELAEKWMIDPAAPGPVAATGVGLVLASMGIFAVVCVASVLVFNHEAPLIAEEL
jgi:ABC-2 type transport system permease protein